MENNMSRHIINPMHDTFGSLFEEIFNPYKRRPGHLPSVMYENNVGTKDKPSIIVRSELVERKFKAWREEDGSYHEELIEADDMSDLPNKPEITA
jgi:hypothetical protein